VTVSAYVRTTPPEGKRQQAKESLKKLQSRCYIGDISSPIDVEWKTNIIEPNACDC